MVIVGPCVRGTGEPQTGRGREGKEWSLGVRGQWGRGVVRMVGGACERGPIDVRGGA